MVSINTELEEMKMLMQEYLTLLKEIMNEKEAKVDDLYQIFQKSNIILKRINELLTQNPNLKILFSQIQEENKEMQNQITFYSNAIQILNKTKSIFLLYKI